MATSMQMRSSSRGRARGRNSLLRGSSLRRRSQRPSRTGRRTRSRGVRSSPRRGRTRDLPRRDARGRFIRRRVRRAPRRRSAPRARPRRTARTLPTTSVVREASRRSVAGPALVKRRWWRVDGPVDPSLPDGYAYER